MSALLDGLRAGIYARYGRQQEEAELDLKRQDLRLRQQIFKGQEASRNLLNMQRGLHINKMLRDLGGISLPENDIGSLPFAQEGPPGSGATALEPASTDGGTVPLSTDLASGPPGQQAPFGSAATALAPSRTESLLRRYGQQNASPGAAHGNETASPGGLGVGPSTTSVSNANAPSSPAQQTPLRQLRALRSAAEQDARQRGITDTTTLEGILGGFDRHIAALTQRR